MGFWYQAIFRAFRTDFFPARKALAMGTLVVGKEPRLPIKLTWGDLRRSYDTMSDLGIDLEFVLEREYLEANEPRPYFSDRDGRRFRILVISLEVVFCVLVPQDYEPAELELHLARVDDAELVLETFRGVPHRALLTSSGRAVPVEALATKDIARMAPREAKEAELDWLSFDEAWLASVDPAPPVALFEWTGRRFTSIFRRSKT